MTVLLACALLTIAIAVYVFYPERQVAAQREKTRLEFLEERKAMLYDNLRDLNFEHRTGKFRDEEYALQRASLETEAAGVVAEMEQLAAAARRQVRRS